MTTDFLKWEQAAECLQRRAATMTPSDEGRALLDRAIEYDRLIAETPAACLADIQVKVRRLAHWHYPPGSRPPTPYTEPLLRTILAGIEQLRIAPERDGGGIYHELAGIKMAHVDIAHSLANARTAINIIADGVRELLREKDKPSR